MLHASQVSKRAKRASGWTVVDDTLGRLQPSRFIPRRRAVRLFQHSSKGL
ncbi:hypothetical protein GPA10_22490 [Streptomyces sp. p1417]|uniref:Uncharacterized protein n=1 Tax=Streptomyces typhae TaxID=2681492 RepID=A0A6L6X0X0_9ACTN|nr:hypothetical protein [Streptomyces typhae]MVO87455.1 hypothetical protein [Streptomyces typhae]